VCVLGDGVSISCERRRFCPSPIVPPRVCRGVVCLGDFVAGFIDSINRAQQYQSIPLHILTQCELILTRIILGEEKYFVGQGVDIGKDG
jgi:hypothetical protein